MNRSPLLRQLMTRGQRIVIPASLTSAPRERGQGEQAQVKRRGGDESVGVPSPNIARYLDDGASQELKSRIQMNQFREAVAKENDQLWKNSKSHLRRQDKLVETFGVEGAVRETLQPSTVSFHKEIMQRPLDQKILEEIYQGLHGRRIERKLKRGVGWEHWTAKGDDTAPVFRSSAKAQQTFGYGGKLKRIASAHHESQFPKVSRAAALSSRVSVGSSSEGIPEVAFIGRTSSGKSSLINALLNAFVCPYGHLQGTTATCDFVSVGGKVLLVDLPGYGYYNPVQTSQLDAENALRVMKEYIAHCDPSHPLHRPIKRVFVCISSRGMQHQDIHYLEMLEKHRVPFSVILTKTDRAPIRFLARLTDYTRCQLIHYKYCEELLLTSALRLAGIEKVQNLIGDVALKKAGEDMASLNFDRIV